MKDRFHTFLERHVDVLVVLIPILLAALALGIVWHIRVLNELTHVRDELTVTTESLQGMTENFTQSEYEKSLLYDALRDEQERLEELGEEFEDVTEVVEKLEKLNDIDEELLQKYSKVSFLNEHYEPENLVSIDRDYLYDESRPQQIRREVRGYLEDMIEDAEDDDVELFVVSAYRSFGTQTALKDNYVVIYGAGTANQFSAEQGFSEHQLGTTVDFTTVGLNGGLDGFENTSAYEWLLDNAHKYGFVLSYPEGNSYYLFEPWHWRFVGKALARHIHRRDIHFYDMDQRDIDEYRPDIFD